MGLLSCFRHEAWGVGAAWDADFRPTEAGLRPLRPKEAVTLPLLRYKEVYRSTAVSVLGSVAIQGMLLISGILAARLLGITNRGHLALFLLFVIILAQVGGLGMPLATTYWIARDGSSARSVVRTVAIPAVVQAVIVASVHCAILVVVFRDSDPSTQVAAGLTLLATPALLIQQYVLGVFLGQRRFRAFSLFRLLPSALYSAVLCVIFATQTQALVFITAAWVASLVITAGVGLRVMLDGLPANMPGDVGCGTRVEMLRFGLRGLLGSIAPLETFNLDQAAVGLFISPAALGLYVVGLAFTNLPQFLAQSVGYVAYPHVAAERNPTTAYRSMWRFVGVTLALSGTVAVLLGLAAPWLITTLFGRSYTSSAPLTRILLIGALFIGLRRVLTDGARGVGRPSIGTIAELVSLGCLAPALALLVPGGGVQGAAWAVSVASAVGLVFLGVALAVRPKVATTHTAMHDVTQVLCPGGDGLDGLNRNARPEAGAPRTGEARNVVTPGPWSGPPSSSGSSREPK